MSIFDTSLFLHLMKVLKYQNCWQYWCCELIENISFITHKANEIEIILHNFAIGINSETKRKFQSLQNSCLRLSFDINYRVHITPYSRRLNLLKLQEKYTLNFADQSYKVITGIFI